jgi:hypothetical protein
MRLRFLDHLKDYNDQTYADLLKSCEMNVISKIDFTNQIVEIICDNLDIVDFLNDIGNPINLVIKCLDYLKSRDEDTYGEVMSLLKINKNTVKYIDFNHLSVDFIADRTREELIEFKDKFILSILKSVNNEFVKFISMAKPDILEIFASDEEFLKKFTNININRNIIEGLYPKFSNPKLKTILFNKYVEQQPDWFKNNIDVKIPDFKVETPIITSVPKKRVVRKKI